MVDSQQDSSLTYKIILTGHNFLPIYKVSFMCYNISIMMKIIYQETIGTFKLVEKIGFFIWMGLASFFDWLNHLPYISAVKSNDFIISVCFFVGALILSPFPWWSALIIMVLPWYLAIPSLIVFYLMFIFSFASSMVFM